MYAIYDGGVDNTAATDDANPDSVAAQSSSSADSMFYCVHLDQPDPFAQPCERFAVLKSDVFNSSLRSVKEAVAFEKLLAELLRETEQPIDAAALSAVPVQVRSPVIFESLQTFLKERAGVLKTSAPVMSKISGMTLDELRQEVHRSRVAASRARSGLPEYMRIRGEYLAGVARLEETIDRIVASPMLIPLDTDSLRTALEKRVAASVSSGENLHVIVGDLVQMNKHTGLHYRYGWYYNACRMRYGRLRARIDTLLLNARDPGPLTLDYLGYLESWKHAVADGELQVATTAWNGMHAGRKQIHGDATIATRVKAYAALGQPRIFTQVHRRYQRGGINAIERYFKPNKAVLGLAGGGSVLLGIVAAGFISRANEAYAAYSDERYSASRMETYRADAQTRYAAGAALSALSGAGVGICLAHMYALYQRRLALREEKREEWTSLFEGAGK